MYEASQAVFAVPYGARIKAAREAAGLSQEALAAALGKSQRSVTNWENDRNEPPAKVLAGIADATRTPLAYLLDGRGAPSQGAPNGAKVAEPATPFADRPPSPSRSDPSRLPPDERGLVRIMHMTVTADAGDGAEVEFEDFDGETWLPAWYVWQAFGTSPERVRRVRVNGVSMRPTIEPGEMVYVVLMNAGEQPVHGAVYIIRSPHGLLIKRLYFETATIERDGTEDVRYYVRIHSDNPEAGEDRLPLAVFLRDYECVAYLRRTEKHL